MKTIDDTYKDIIKAFQKNSLADLRELDSRLAAQGCLFGDRPIPCFIKPYLISAEFEDHIADTLKHVTRMLEKIVQAYFSNRELHPVFGLSSVAEKYIQVDPGYKKSIVIARPDAFIDRGEIKFLEFNCDSPAGAGYADVQEAILKQTFAMKRLSQHYEWGKPMRLNRLLASLLACYREFGGRVKTPHIAIVDWRDVRTQGEFEITRAYFESRGIPCWICDPRELRLRGGKLYYNKNRIDLVYRRVIFHELMARRGQCADFLKAYFKNQVCVVNPLRSRLAANKAVVSLMSNPEFDGLFSSAEREVRDRCIPWTRRVIDAEKVYIGKKKAVRDILIQHQEQLVIKPSESYGGKNVRIGRETSRREWKSTVERVLKHEERWVAQRYVKTPHMEVPLLRNTKVSMMRKKMNLNPFVFGGKYAGSMVRLSDESVINVSAGGGLIPAITVKGPRKLRKRK